MVLRGLKLRDFRNYAAAQVELKGPMVVVQGGNAQGKTNLVEAIVVACRGRPLRATADSQLVRWGAQFAAVRAEAATRQRGELRLEARIVNGRRQILINGVRRRPADVIGLAPVIAFTVDDLEIVKGEPAARRRFLNLEMASQSRSYHFGLLRYNRALEQRNRHLREMRQSGVPGDALDTWDEQVARAGSQIVARRARFLAELGPLCSEAHAGVAGEESNLKLLYQPALAGEPDLEREAATAEDIEDRLLAGLRGAREEDMARGATTVGPHRDEVEFALGGHSLRVFGSQGEQRTAAVALRLALARWVAQQQDEPPVLLLDDVLSELDEPRRAGLLEAVAVVEQTIITCSDLEAVPEEVRRGAAVIRVEGGTAAAWQPLGEATP